MVANWPVSSQWSIILVAREYNEMEVSKLKWKSGGR